MLERGRENDEKISRAAHGPTALRSGGGGGGGSEETTNTPRESKL